jgi:hypothetical protein
MPAMRTLPGKYAMKVRTGGRPQFRWLARSL